MDATSNASNGRGKGKAGAPVGNRNAMRHGLRSGKLPKNTKYIENAVNSLRRQLEDAVIAARGEVSLTDAASINSAVKWERHGKLAAHWLRHEMATLPPTDRLKFSNEIAKASDHRDKAIRALNLNIKPEPEDLETYVTGKGEV